MGLGRSSKTAGRVIAGAETEGDGARVVVVEEQEVEVTVAGDGRGAVKVEKPEINDKPENGSPTFRSISVPSDNCKAVSIRKFPTKLVPLNPEELSVFKKNLRAEEEKDCINKSQSFDLARGLNQYFSTLVIKEMVYTDTGKYTCYYEGTISPGNSRENSTSLYVFVNDDSHIFLPHDQNYIMLVSPPKPLKLSCLPTNSKANITLVKIGNGGNEIIPTGEEVYFDPTQGFTVNHPTTNYDGSFACFGQLGNFNESFHLHLIYMPSTTTILQPEIDSSMARQPVVNGTFNLTCLVKVDPETLVLMKWDYPNKSKNDSRIIESNPTASLKTFKGSVYKVVKSKLIVTSVRHSDEGDYICTVIDHSQTSNSYKVAINIYAKAVTKIMNQKDFYMLQKHYRLTCMVIGYPIPQVSWLWKICSDLNNCDPGSIYGWIAVNVSDTSSLPNIYDIKRTVEDTDVIMLHLDVVANVSGYYKCLGRNYLGQDKYISRFIVSDARNGFETIAVPSKPVEKDEVNLTCRTNVFKYTNLTWMWYSMYEDSNDSLHITNQTGISQDFVSNPYSLSLTLVFHNISINNSGIYECLAWHNNTPEIKENQIINITVRAGGAFKLPKSSTQIELETMKQPPLNIAERNEPRIYSTSNITCGNDLQAKQKREMDFFSYAQFEHGQLHMFNPDLPLDEQIELLPYDNHWEFPKENLKLGKTLGQGAFGRVVKAEAFGLEDAETTTVVAVKMLKEHADQEQKKALMAELKILIHLGHHLNIVNVLGAVTRNATKGELMVIVEYCCYGNIRHYLLQNRENFISQLNPKTGKIDPNICTLPGSDRVMNKKEESIKYVELTHDQTTRSTSNSTGRGVKDSESTEFTDVSSRSSTVNSGYFNRASVKKKDDTSNEAVSTCDLLCWAFQVSRGMEYLESRKLIHRDLAARNVLLSEDNIVKICDFGLAKDCYKYSNYVKKGDGPLPVKWMAIESIRDKVFTIQSDVWSFGVLMWEFFTLGSNPYPGIDVDEEFYKKLKNGYRMEKPELCPDDVYNIMQDCWKEEPAERPDFTALVDKLGNLLESSVRKYYVELNNPYMMMNETSQNNNDYLTMEGTNTDYTNMRQNDQLASKEPEARLSDPWNYYDNISTCRPVGDGPAPKEPMEVVPMIQLESVGDTWHDRMACIPKDNPEEMALNESNSPDYMFMGGTNSDNQKVTKKKKLNDSVFTDPEDETHSGSINVAHPSYSLVVVDSPSG
ncbi:mast/stem cell growth factor receptor kita-like [Limulus polyphemus]|uniref:receptor protein-tyrosine kinase n=1 Tax=Limulus polyphemus TaxID=6850 RepID=A0ABM1BKU1_LIMPO|nr:mast/stem cell growth factor receptor kita-like [Limulus polyphemus]